MEKRNDGFVNFCVEWTCGFVNLQIRVDQKFCATLLCSVVDALWMRWIGVTEKNVRVWLRFVAWLCVRWFEIVCAMTTCCLA